MIVYVCVHGLVTLLFEGSRPLWGTKCMLYSVVVIADWEHCPTWMLEACRASSRLYSTVCFNGLANRSNSSSTNTTDLWPLQKAPIQSVNHSRPDCTFSFADIDQWESP